MKNLIVMGDPGFRKDGVIEYDGEEWVVFSVKRQGEWSGPDEPQLWCVVGAEDERDDFEERNYVPHFLETETVDAEDVTIVKRAGDRAVA